MYLESLKGCQLIIGSYPPFNYDASGGGGIAIQKKIENKNIKELIFDPTEFEIPSLNWRTTKILGIPLPPGLEITIYPKRLEGTINERTGEIILNFESRFVLKIAIWFKAPALIVKTSLTSNDASEGNLKVKGKPLNKEGFAKLVGIALVPKSGNHFLDNFLGLPNKALAILQCKFDEE